MKIDGIRGNNIIEMYKHNNNNNIKPKANVAEGEDTIEISKVGKNLNSMSDGLKSEMPEAEIQRIKEAVANGTYKPDAKLVAQKMINIIKGREV